jgi:hypothetical protein
LCPEKSGNPGGLYQEFSVGFEAGDATLEAGLGQERPGQNVVHGLAHTT